MNKLSLPDLTPEQERALIYESDVIYDLGLSWSPHPHQSKVKNAVFRDHKKLVFLECGRKYGKTEMLCYLLYRYALLYPNSACYYIAPFQKQAKEIIWATGRIQNFFQPLLNPKTKLTDKGHTFDESHQIREELNEKYGVKVNESEMRIRFGNGSFIKLDGADNHQAYRGISPSIILYDEFKDHHPKFHVGMDPNLGAFDAPLIIVGTPTEGDEDNATQFNSLADYAKISDRGAYFNAPTSTNPFISRDFLKRKKEELYARGEEDKWLREYMAKRVKSGQRSIFPMFEDIDEENKEYTVHVRPKSEVEHTFSKSHKDWDYFLVFDPASASTFGVLLGCIHKKSKRLLILDEIYEQKKGNMSAGRIFPRGLALLDKWNIMHDKCRMIYDNAATWFQTEVAAQFSYGLEPCIKDVKKKEDRLSLIKDIFLNNIIQINEECVNFRWEVQNYKTDEHNRIPKENDHLIDAFRYMLAGAYYNRVSVIDVEADSLDNRRYYTLDNDMTRLNSDKDPFEHINQEYYI